MNDQYPQPLMQLLQAWNMHNVEAVAGCFASDYHGSDVSEAKPLIGRAAIRSYTRRVLRAFPDLHLSYEAQMKEDDQVVVFWQMTGTHEGPFLNIPPTRRPVVVEGVMRLTVQNGQIQKGKVVWDLAGLLRTFGLLPRLRVHPEEGS